MHTKEALTELLRVNNRAVERAMVRLYERQTSDEQASKTTKYRNGRGFSGCDAGIGSYYARWVQAGKPLSGKHLERARRMACKYVGQLVEIANERVAKPMQAHMNDVKMAQAEAAADRAESLRDEQNKMRAKTALEAGYRSW